FKAEAVALFRFRAGAAIKSVAIDLGVNTGTVRNWIRAAGGRCSGSHSASPHAVRSGGDGVEAGPAAARNRLWELEEERDILRKAAWYFAGETCW
ncbi:transposase, partial [Streptomyces sp. NPDC006283]|uniref:transposase n=1 Tax=Streptomyces sp. NPDC006283 TaxID=3156741 RepID=UPI0033AE7D6A